MSERKPKGDPHSPTGKGSGAPPPGETSTRSDFSRFVIRFLIALLLFSSLSTIFSIQNHLWPLENGLAAGAGAIARLVRVNAARTGNTVSAGGAQIEINHECTAFFVVLIYASFLLAYPATAMERLRGFLLGLVVLMIVNVIRLGFLVVVIAQWPKLFDYFHEYFWQVLFLGLMTVLANRWLSTLAGQRELLVLPR